MRPDRKRARLAVQPRLTAFLQPESKEQRVRTHASKRAVLQNGLGVNGPVGEREGKAPYLQEDTQSAGKQLKLSRKDSLSSFNGVNAVEVKAAAATESRTRGAADCSQKKNALVAFLKRQPTTPAELKGENVNPSKETFGRTLHGSAYAQCPICTIQIPLTRMNHHLDIECVQQATGGKRDSSLISAGHSGEGLRTRSGPSHELKQGEVQRQARSCEREDVSGAERGLPSAVASDGLVPKFAGQEGLETDIAEDTGEAQVSEASEREASGESSRDSEIMPTLNEWLPSEGETKEGLHLETSLVTSAEEETDRREKQEALQVNRASDPLAKVKHNSVEGQEEHIHTDNRAQEERVNTLLGMVREKGQRPLFGLSWSALQMRQPSAPKGHYLVENFLSEEEEAHIIASLDADVSNPWKTSRVFGDLNQGKSYGVVTDLKRRKISKPKRPMPAFLQSVLERIRTVAPPLSEFVPNECNAINYCKSEGHWLRAHVDDRQLSGTIIAGISLHSDCVMTYKKERGRPESFRVRLPRRCLQVQTSDSRYNYTHSIKNPDLLGERRVSITFRQVAEPQP